MLRIHQYPTAASLQIQKKINQTPASPLAGVRKNIHLLRHAPTTRNIICCYMRIAQYALQSRDGSGFAILRFYILRCMKGYKIAI
jgi:hypothetical protein